LEILGGEEIVGCRSKSATLIPHRHPRDPITS